jgi:hypothetical protein
MIICLVRRCRLIRGVVSAEESAAARRIRLAMRRIPALVLAVAGAVLLPATTVPSIGHAAPVKQFVLSPEGNNLWAYDAATLGKQLVVHGVNSSGTGGATAPPGSQRRDINGQICVAPDRRHIITGEDTVIGSGSSHDPRIAGWGFFEISGNTLGSIRVKEVGKLAPEAGTGPGYTGDPDNYGCGFLGANRLFTSALGNTLPGEEANGQLFLWFGPFTNGFRQVQDGGVKFFVGEVPHCEIDHTLATAGGIAVDRNGDVYVTANRPDGNGHPGAVWRYRGVWPTTPEQCTPSYIKTHITRSRILPKNPNGTGLVAPTPSAVAISPHDTLYVSSVFTGTVSEITKAGNWVRDVFPTSPVAPRTGPTSQTPFGLAVTADKSLWIADLGIVGAVPAPGEGSVIRVPFDQLNRPKPGGDVVNDGLTFPDGLGVYTPR